MTLEENSIKIKKKKKQSKKLLPKNVFEIVGETGQTIERVDSNSTKKIVEQLEETEPKPTFSERTKKRRRREWDAMNYEPFDITRARDYERSLQRIATRGIVQLFNTVRKQQQNSSSSSTITKNKKENTINKGEFLDMLKTIDSDEVSCKIMKKNQSTTESTTKTTPVRWNVLQDDLMASVKDDDDDDDNDD
ncbi:unnamed protein product [Rotaria sp. Silwood1]|nr:unnamed protein product [Rotaria sp. Silwood1]CAF1599677.1 unnamed protein product [Rotaria sp. Silwood1]CAF3676223.1 unnamed protein product [Rotaria sp. Silwood1]CAF3742491.1 unnamed protein product [Rotaria sp. Silwood1]CAF4676628.1 unnamed protein product [Rotaria sp. Silwood1]